MGIIFDGKAYAQKKKTLLSVGVLNLKSKGITPRLATILIGENVTSELYVNLKKKFIEGIGCEVDVYKLPEKVEFKDIEILIKSLNDDDLVHGIMVQLPLPSKLLDFKSQILDLISSKKDVDGLREDSKFLHPTSKAVLEILKIAEAETKKEAKSVSVIGALGMVGKPLVKELKKLGYEVYETANNESDVMVSATGKTNLITSEMLKEDVIVIDVGSPFGDVSSEVSKKASFFTPVPGGVGPVTITCLAENLIEASNN